MRFLFRLQGQAADAGSIVDFEHNLDDYVPAKKKYHFYFTYKIVHPWWDTVALGMEDAQKKYLEKGIIVGSHGAPCHEDRANGARDTIAKYPDMEIVAVEYDMDSIDKAYELAVKMLTDTPDIAGLVCCNMSNPVGAARAVTELGSTAVIVGMDHDQEALRYLKDGVIYCLGVQDCYSIGCSTLQPDDGQLSDIFQRADQIIYDRKKELKTLGAKTREFGET